MIHKNFFNKRQIKDKISGETRDLEFKDVAEHFSKSDLCHIVATRGHIVIGDKEQRFSLIIRDDGTWELV